uniref:hypothetical protein n=1 Tax=Methylobacterium sp. B34 TaxID=95563 RepID=UPI0003448FEE|nr:hypothetical protein [Methylobacterium sp. B34]
MPRYILQKHVGGTWEPHSAFDDHNEITPRISAAKRADPHGGYVVIIDHTPEPEASPAPEPVVETAKRGRKKVKT